MVIPGHDGRRCDEADVVEYRDMLTIIRHLRNAWPPVARAGVAAHGRRSYEARHEDSPPDFGARSCTEGQVR